ncbi:hypothetical protein [Desulfomicrobium salsuginis]
MRVLAVCLACLGISLILPAMARCQEILAVEIDLDAATLMTNFTVVMSAPRPRHGVDVLIQNDERAFKADHRITPPGMNEKIMTCEMSLLAPFDSYRITTTDDAPPFLVSTKRLAGKLAAARASALPWSGNPEHQDGENEEGDTDRGIASFHLPRSDAARLLIVVFDADGRIADQHFGVYPAGRAWTSRPLPFGTYRFAMAGTDRSGKPVAVEPEKAFLDQAP